MMRMAKSVMVVFAAAVVAMLWKGGAAQSTSGCTMALVSLSPCLNYVSGNSSSPSSSCCSSLSSVVASQPQCLCSLLNGGSASNLGISVNQTLALALPSACSVQTPPISRCNTAGGVSGPTSAPAPAADSPADEAPTTPSSSTIPSDAGAGAGSKTVPTKTEGSSNSGSAAAFSVVGSILFVASSSWAFSSSPF